MNASAIKAMMAEMAPVIREYIDTQTAPLKSENDDLRARIKELERRELLLPEKGDQGERGEQGPAGESADMDLVKQWVDEGIKAAVAELPV